MSRPKNGAAIQPYRIDGSEYFSVKQFAVLTNRTYQSVMYLMKNGNRVRRLRVVRIADRPLIPAAELVEFPFTSPGGRVEVYHYDKNGNAIYET